MDHSFTDIEFQRVRELITERLALNFPIEGWGILRLRLASAAQEFGFQDMTLFVRWLLITDLNNDQIQILASHLTITETYFWREPQVFKAMADTILPELISDKMNRNKSIRIWSAGCSTGEEPYSLAMAIHRAIPNLKGWKISILATDINPKALEKARKGVYSSWSFRNTPDWLKSGYFNNVHDNSFEIIPEIRDMVTFSSFNLARENYISTICNNQKLDIIFCRNVLMYFTKAWAARVSGNLYDSLSDNGFLVVSSCELSSDLYPQFRSVNFPGAILYRKGKNEFNDDNPVLQDFSNQVSSEPAYITPEVALIETISKYDQNTEADEDIIIKKGSIRMMASQGDLEGALEVCNDAIESDKLIRSLYYLKASILQEMDRKPEAIKTLKQAIFIDPDYIIGHFTLGNIFNQIGNSGKSKKYYKNALELLDTISNDAIPPESGGFSVSYIRETILSNLQTQHAS
jgi:chemotaxis protein methyltransferase CheR